MSRGAVYAIVEAAVSPVVVTSGGDAETATPTVFPFVIVQLSDGAMPAYGSMSLVGTRYFQVWVHDRYGSYTRIDALLGDIKRALSDATQVTWTDPVTQLSETLVQADWSGDSGDLADQGYETITRNTTFRVLTREGS